MRTSPEGLERVLDVSHSVDTAIFRGTLFFLLCEMISMSLCLAEQDSKMGQNLLSGILTFTRTPVIYKHDLFDFADCPAFLTYLSEG